MNVFFERGDKQENEFDFGVRLRKTKTVFRCFLPVFFVYFSAPPVS
jgi:hypothetical protein